MTKQSIDNIRAICRVFPDDQDAILLFPDQEERDGSVNSWQPNRRSCECISRSTPLYETSHERRISVYKESL